jgi:hypothetical protein
MLLLPLLATCKANIPLKVMPAESPVGAAIARDMVLIYDSHWSARPLWNEERFAPYVSVPQASGQHDWLFDGFLFIEFKDAERELIHGFHIKPARKQEWTALVNHYTDTAGISMHALNSYIEKIKDKAPSHGRRKVVITMPEPIADQTDWGEIDGKALDFTKHEDRLAACKWYVDYALAKYKAAGLNNLQLTGFYWASESMKKSRPIIREVADYVHSKGLHFYWIPYFGSDGNTEWASFGFDEAWLQPNYFFYNLPESRLDEACNLANEYSMSNEMEFDGRACQGNDPAFKQKMLNYLDAFTRNNVFRDKNITYYEGGDGLYRFKNGVPEDVALYRQFTDIIVERQKRFYEK